MILEHDTSIGLALHAQLKSLYPICRSITGDGVRKTLAQLQSEIPVDVHEVPSGTQVFDWTVPREWNIRDAWIESSDGLRVLDFQNHNLHVMSYSVPIRETLSLEELLAHVHSLPDRPDAIPYKTSYYKETWGFCMSHRARQALKEDRYQVCIDSALTQGSLTYGEYLIPGATRDEVLVSSHICHPSLANDNLSGIVVAVALAKTLASRSNLRYSYRFLFIPGTIGAITWLARNEELVSRIQHGLVLSGVGDAGAMTYKRSRRGTAVVDRAVEHVLKTSRLPYSIADFTPYGYDERQFCSPGFNLPVGCFCRSPYGTYPEYHTSDDNPEFVKAESLSESLATLVRVIDVLEGNSTYLNTNPKCEPQLGSRGLYKELGEESDTMAMLWALNFSDGDRSLLDIAERSDLPFERLLRVCRMLESHGLLRKKSN